MLSKSIASTLDVFHLLECAVFIQILRDIRLGIYHIIEEKESSVFRLGC